MLYGFWTSALQTSGLLLGGNWARESFCIPILSWIQKLTLSITNVVNWDDTDRKGLMITRAMVSVQKESINPFWLRIHCCHWGTKIWVILEYPASDFLKESNPMIGHDKCWSILNTCGICFLVISSSNLRSRFQCK